MKIILLIQRKWFILKVFLRMNSGKENREGVKRAQDKREGSTQVRKGRAMVLKGEEEEGE